MSRKKNIAYDRTRNFIPKGRKETVMEYDHRITGEVIRRLRRERKLTQEGLSGLAAVSRSQLSMIEHGRIDAQVETLWRIAEALGVPLSQVMELVEKETKARNML